jgi:hypothetical protein
MDTNPSKSRLKHQQQQEQTSEQQITSQAGNEFASVEDLLRYDAKQTTLPPAIAERLQSSLKTEPPPKRSWWQRLFGI